MYFYIPVMPFLLFHRDWVYMGSEEEHDHKCCPLWPSCFPAAQLAVTPAVVQLSHPLLLLRKNLIGYWLIKKCTQPCWLPACHGPGLSLFSFFVLYEFFQDHSLTVCVQIMGVVALSLNIFCKISPKIDFETHENEDLRNCSKKNVFWIVKQIIISWG